MLAADDQTPLWFKAFVTLAVWSGMRPSEVRGLPWRCVDFERGLIKVRQRADFAGTIGAPKSKAGRRDVPMTPSLKRALQEFYLASGRPAPDRLVFATRTGQPMSHSNIVQRFYEPLQRRLGMAGPKVDIDDKPVLDRTGKPRLLYGLHSLRHAAASLFIDQRWSAKQIQTVMGHSSIQMVFDTYGKLFRGGDDADQAAMARLEASLLG
jgi:integrase